MSTANAACESAVPIPNTMMRPTRPGMYKPAARMTPNTAMSPPASTSDRGGLSRNSRSFAMATIGITTSDGR